MRLKSRLSGRDVLIYREKWGAMAFVATMGVACLAMAAGSLLLLGDQAGTPRAFLIGFSSLFGFAGAALLLRLPAMARRTFDEGGAHVFSADSGGISITASLGARRLAVLWASVEEVVFARSFRIIESGETTLAGRAAIVFLLKDEYDSWSVTERINAAASRSGSGRPYLHVPFPGNQERLLAGALRQYAPAMVRVRTEKLAVFDYRRSADTYSSG